MSISTVTLDGKVFKLVPVDDEKEAKQEIKQESQTSQSSEPVEEHKCPTNEPKLVKIGVEDGEDGERTYIYKKIKRIPTANGDIEKEIQVKRKYKLHSGVKDLRRMYAIEAIKQMPTLKNAFRRHEYYINYLLMNHNDEPLIKPYAVQTFDTIYREYLNRRSSNEDLS